MQDLYRLLSCLSLGGPSPRLSLKIRRDERINLHSAKAAFAASWGHVDRRLVFRECHMGFRIPAFSLFSSAYQFLDLSLVHGGRYHHFDAGWEVLMYAKLVFHHQP